MYNKFDRLEAMMQERTTPEPTVDEIIAHRFNGHSVLSEAFRSDVLVQAKRLISGNEGALAEQLANLYKEIGGVAVKGNSPMDLLRRYIIWLSDKDWDMTLRILSIDSRAFQQFRREEANRHPYGFDPLTGR